MKVATLMQRSGRNTCAKCGSGGPLTIDHIIPTSFYEAIGIKGMANKESNMQLLCTICNQKKSNFLEMSDWSFIWFLFKVHRMLRLKKKLESLTKKML